MDSMTDFQGFRAKYSSHKEVIERLYLKAFINSFGRIKDIENISTLLENQIRDKFQYDFEHSNSLITPYINNQTVTFNSESQIITEDAKYRTDIKLFCAWYRKHFIVECKRLSSANQSYIKGRYNKEKNRYEVNGIERFVTSTYAKQDDYAGLIGFIIKKNPNKIVEKLKLKIVPFHSATNIEFLLKQKCVGWDLSFQSKHIRTNNTEIHLYHLFFDFSN